MRFALGIDTGGTYTDAALVDYDTGQVMVQAKALTTRHDLTIGIGEALTTVLTAATHEMPLFSPEAMALVALSTTLATNAMAEGHRATVALILIGYDRLLMEQYGFHRELSTDDVIYIGGGHDLFGDEVAPLDEDAARMAILARKDTVEAFAVSGYFGVRNPAHENRVRALIQELTDRPVTCGHELTSQLNAVRRATTTALNAHLILPLQELIQSVQDTMGRSGITAPLMVVKGDGSLVRAEWARQRPIETILSGPAASLVGAWHLGGRRDVWVVDVGGTTTDIGALEDGAPLLNPDGAHVAGWRPMVEAIDVHTVGLGGDSHVRLGQNRELLIGPRRVIPLSLLASQYPHILDDLRRQAASRPEKLREEAGEFLVLGRQPANSLPEGESQIVEQLGRRPQAMSLLMDQARAHGLFRRSLENLQERGLVRRSAFTPTDALHALGRFQRWNVEAATIAAGLLATRTGLPMEAFCEGIIKGVADRIASELVGKVLADEVGPATIESEPFAKALIKRAFDGLDRGDLGCRLSLRRPLVAIGAPAGAYMPGVAERLNTDVLIPAHAEVANAVGAVSGSVVKRAQASIQPLGEGDQLRVYLPDGVKDFSAIEEAIQYVRKVMIPYVERLVSQAGGEQIEVHVSRRDFWVPVRGIPGEQLYMGSELGFAAVGRPSPARR